MLLKSESFLFGALLLCVLHFPLNLATTYYEHHCTPAIYVHAVNDNIMVFLMSIVISIVMATFMAAIMATNLATIQAIFLATF